MRTKIPHSGFVKRPGNGTVHKYARWGLDIKIQQIYPILEKVRIYEWAEFRDIYREQTYVPVEPDSLEETACRLNKVLT